ncbi:hypothetical protein NXS19_001812 [Fusarium pseudograminearum]|nr:hypothetical protein NXS19_001812 [Fusarium pseudograminearum]
MIFFLCLQVDTHLCMEVVSRMSPKTLQPMFYTVFFCSGLHIFGGNVKALRAICGDFDKSLMKREIACCHVLTTVLFKYNVLKIRYGGHLEPHTTKPEKEHRTVAADL